MADLQITGAEKFAAVARALKQVGDKELQRDLAAGLNRAARPLMDDAKRAASDRLPRRGGLNRQIARTRMTVRRRGGKNPSVRIVAKGGQVRLIDTRGKVKHPVYGHSDRWVTQNIPAAEGWFTETMENGSDEVRKELIRVLDRVARKLARRY